MATDQEFATLMKRVAELEDFQMDVMGLLRKWSARRSQTDLLPLSTGPTDAGIALKILTAELVARYEVVVGSKYIHMGAQDAAAVKRLLGLKNELRSELLDRWERCLRLKGFPGTRSLAQFVQRIREFDIKNEKPLQVVNGDPYAT